MITRREFMKKTAIGLTGLVATLSPTILIASTSAYPYKAPESRKDLYNIPESHLLARAIFGEGANCIEEERIAIAYTPINRGGSIKKNLLAPNQYNCFDEYSENPGAMENIKRTLNPARYDIKTWKECLEIAKEVIENKHEELNKWQTVYMTKPLVEKWERKNNMPKWLKNNYNPITINPWKENDFKHQFFRKIA